MFSARTRNLYDVPMGKMGNEMVAAFGVFQISTVSMALTVMRGYVSRRQRAYNKFVAEVQTLNGHISAMS